ncbi:LacI family DNA-binding transcriptional regulator [Pedobacter hartonius]|uniref:Transcriptional regulator, LacI family n=1 Tax=Pedobacter hartonius TaxID=425514 RepID=A0A1H4BMB9_9SPHI|nr:substrate-binding domain-containing protein [Pedobacter hartonius]SEA48972.1 transcriptional regulator, LacI family [Pedobacter hartonius]
MKKHSDAELSGVKEIARRANVSIATVDRVIHNRTGVSENTKNTILAIIKELDYQPNILARRLASKKQLHLAILIPAISQETEFWKAPLTGIEQAESEIRQYGIRIEKYFFDQNDKSSFVAQTKKILKSTVDGILLAPSFINESLEFTRECQHLNIPYVFINSDIPNQDSLGYIGPDLFHSGYLSAHLTNYAIEQSGKVLIINISKEMDNFHHLLRKEEGFTAYFKDNQKNNSIVKADIRQTDYPSVASRLKELLVTHPDVKAIFVTNSRVFSVARFMEESEINDVLLIGYDYLTENIRYLKSGAIDFLICQKPQEQGYRGIMTLYQNLVLHTEVDKAYFMPIDIITKENYKFYRN